jgi:hypothetical protein
MQPKSAVGGVNTAISDASSAGQTLDCPTDASFQHASDRLTEVEAGDEDVEDIAKSRRELLGGIDPVTGLHSLPVPNLGRLRASRSSSHLR